MKSMGAASIKRIFSKLHNRVVTYGSTKNINRTRQDIEKKILEEKPKWILMPDNNFKRIWNVIIIVLLGYVAFYVPYHICFSKKKVGN